MELKELMLDDFVMIDGKIGKIKFISDSNALVQIGEDEAVDTDSVEPIPLTIDILSKNGFVGEGYQILTLDDGHWLEYYHHEHRLTRCWEGIDEWQNHSKVMDIVFRCHCYYVHELQHALKLCGIKKEIVL